MDFHEACTLAWRPFALSYIAAHVVHWAEDISKRLVSATSVKVNRLCPMSRQRQQDCMLLVEQRWL